MENIIDKMKDNRFKMILKENSVYLTNYKRIIILEEDLVKIKTNKKTIEIKGNNIKAKRILYKELLLVGNITKIEVIDEF
ncbi:MAG: YabP/YqfC family sporulation protein [Bacilli bacterium]|nr:YabP/YqfC family sporulation protein [Bacilli bacterium]